jgi:hypothetical protein
MELPTPYIAETTPPVSKENEPRSPRFRFNPDEKIIQYDDEYEENQENQAIEISGYVDNFGYVNGQDIRDVLKSLAGGRVEIVITPYE